MSKPVEPGCLARIIAFKAPTDHGKIVSVGVPVLAGEVQCGKFIYIMGSSGFICTSLSGPLLAVGVDGAADQVITRPIQTINLKRIDDPSDTDVDTTYRHIPIPEYSTTGANAWMHDATDTFKP